MQYLIAMLIRAKSCFLPRFESPTEDECLGLIELFDQNHNGQIDCAEYCPATKGFSRETNKWINHKTFPRGSAVFSLKPKNLIYQNETSLALRCVSM